MSTVRVSLPHHLRTLAGVPAEVEVEIRGDPTVDAVLDALDLAPYYLFHAVRADLLRRLDRVEDARAAYDEAIARVGNAAERAFLEKRRDDLSAQGSDE